MTPHAAPFHRPGNPLALTEELAHYLTDVFHYNLQHPDVIDKAVRPSLPIIPPITMPAVLVAECDYIANILAVAYRNECEHSSV